MNDIQTGYMCSCGYWFVVVATDATEKGHIQKTSPRCGRCRQPLDASAYLTYEEITERLNAAKGTRDD